MTVNQSQHPELAANQPATEETPKQQPDTSPVGDPTALIDPKTGLIMGKWKSWDEAKSGYWSSGQEAQKLIQQRDEALQKAQLMEQIVQGGRVNPGAAAVERVNAFEKLESEYGVPSGPLRQAIQEMVVDAITPITEGARARQEVMSALPEFAQFENEVALFLATNPDVNAEYQRMVNAGAARGAMKYAFYEYRQNVASQTPKERPGVDPTTKADASPGNAQVGPRNAMPQDDSDQLERARQWARIQGDTTPLRKLWFKDMLPDSMFKD